MDSTQTQIQADDSSRWAAVVFGIAGAFLVWTMLPGLHWHDTGEFGAVSWFLSISHPPGHPLHAILTHGVQKLFLGDLTFRANLASALLLAVSTGGFFLVLRMLAPSMNRFGLVCLSLIPLCLPAIWLQGARAEVYALQILLSVAITALTLLVARGTDGRHLIACALLFGLAGANHSLLGLMLVPFTLVAMFIGRVNLRSIAGASLAGLAGLSTYLYLPIRSGDGREIGWGVPDTFERVWEIISAREWSRSVSIDAGPESGLEILAVLSGFVFEQFGLFSSLLCIGILAASVPMLVRKRRIVGLAVAGLVAVPFVFRLFYPPDLLNPDLGGYLSLGFLALIALVAIALETWSFSSLAMRFVPMLLLLVTLASFDQSARTQSRTAERFAHQLLTETPVGGVLVYSDYASFFQGWCLRSTQGIRPDVRLLFRGQIRTPWFQERLARHDSALAATLGDFPSGFGRPEVRFEPGVKLEQLGGLQSELVALGLTLGVGQLWVNPLESQDAFASFQGEDPDSIRNAAFVHAQHLDHILKVSGPSKLAHWHFSRLQSISPDDPWVAALRSRLRSAQEESPE